jgi:hypothetical protein
LYTCFLATCFGPNRPSSGVQAVYVEGTCCTLLFAFFSFFGAAVSWPIYRFGRGELKTASLLSNGKGSAMARWRRDTNCLPVSFKTEIRQPLQSSFYLDGNEVQAWISNPFLSDINFTEDVNEE